MSQTRIEWGFRLPEREARRLYSVSEEDARSFVSTHPQCELVRRVVQISDWERV